MAFFLVVAEFGNTCDGRIVDLRIGSSCYGHVVRRLDGQDLQFLGKFIIEI